MNITTLMDEVLYKSVGTLHYSYHEGYNVLYYRYDGTIRECYRDGYGHKLVLRVDQGISDYYRALIPKWIHTNPQFYPAHVSIVRHEVPVNLEAWDKHEGEKIEFHYSPIVHHGKVYYWLNVFCNRLEEIRVELGLPVRSEYTIPPDGFTKCFHMTIGNIKEKIQVEVYEGMKVKMVRGDRDHVMFDPYGIVRNIQGNRCEIHFPSDYCHASITNIGEGKDFIPYEWTEKERRA